MILWFDAHFSPAIAAWAACEFGIDCVHVDALGYRFSTDLKIFEAAKTGGVDAIVSKDADYLKLQERLGVPPALLWVTCGNTSNASLRRIFSAQFQSALALIRAGEPLVEIA